MSDFIPIYRAYVQQIHETFSVEALNESDGASPAQLALLKTTYTTLPGDLLVLLRLRNGDNQTALLPPYRLSPCDHIIKAFQSNRKCWDEVDALVGSEGWGAARPSGAVKLSQSWREHWISIGDCNGDDLFIDMDPGPTGTVGQIVFACTDGMTLKVHAQSLAQLLETAANYLMNNPAEFSLTGAFD